MPDLDPCALLRQADAAWIALNTGGSIRAVTDQNGERVEFSTANRSGLLSLIRTLQPQCDTYTSIALSAVNRPMRYLF